jgi:polar amino acid transport system permease protein/polar amino acid transport system substrate-binding protein
MEGGILLPEFLEKLKSTFILNFIDGSRWRYLWVGLGNTLRITFVALILGILLGAVIAVVRASWDKNGDEMRPGLSRSLLHFFNGLFKLYLTVFRGTPVVVQLMILYYIVFVSSNNGVMIASLAFGLNSAAYVAEIFRSGIMSIDNGQFEAGRSLGFNYVQTMWHIILPQAVKNVLPALGNEFITLLKETSVSGYISVQDLTKGGDIIRGRTYSAFMPLIAVALVYLIMVVFLEKLMTILEQKLRNSDH